MGSPPPDAFSVNSDLVVLNVTVQDHAGHPISGLEKANFRVYEDRRLQQIRTLQHDDLPAAVALVVDNSSSMRPKREEVVAAAREFARLSNPLDELLILDFNERLTVAFEEPQLASAREPSLENALSTISTSGRTALYDAVAAGFDQLKAASRYKKKKAMIIITDGVDNASLLTFQELLRKALQSGAACYTVGLFEEEDVSHNTRVLRKLASVTGGLAFFPKRASEVVDVGDVIARELRNQYTISYVPSNREETGKYRAIHVDVITPQHRRLRVRARSGYIEPAGAPSPNRE